MGKLRNYFLNHYPRTDFHELNQDWLISMLFDMINQVENFVELNSVKYADPIQWSITSQYEKNTIVVDRITGTAYISSKPVPFGVALSRTEYWSVIFDLSRFITLASQNFANSYEAVLTTTATMTTDKDKWVVWNSILYRAKNDIHVGDMYVVDGNIERYTVEMFFDELAHLIAEETEARIEADTALHGEVVDESVARENADVTLQDNIDTEATARKNADDALQDNIDAEATARENADDALQDNIDAEATARENADVTLQGNIDAEATARENADNALSDADIAINNKIGNLSDLNTDNKDNIVVAINDALSRARIYESKSALINDTNTHNINELVYVEEVDCYYKIVATSSQITLTLNNKYAELLPDNDGFYHVDGVTTTVNQDIYPIINYLFSNNHTFIYIGKGSYFLSNTLTISGQNTPAVKIRGAGKYNTCINCREGFIYALIDHAYFRGSEFIGFTASGTTSDVVGGQYNGFEFISANDSPEDMYDNVRFDDMLIRYFNIAIRISIRSIWNLWTNTDLIYNTYGFVFSKTTVDSFFNCNTFINCRISQNKARAVSIYGRKGQAVSNNFIGCSIESSYYTNEASSGNLVELDLSNAGVLLTGCHFEKSNTMPNATAICCVNSNLVVNECFFYNYTSHVYTNSYSQIVFNQPSLYGDTSLTAYGTDTGTTIKNNAFTF